MVSFEVAGGEGAVRELTAALECFTLAESLGGVESLIAHPATMTHASMDAEARRIAGIGDGLLRLSVGIEDAADLVKDLVRALDAVSARALVEAGVGPPPRRGKPPPDFRAGPGRSPKPKKILPPPFPAPPGPPPSELEGGPSFPRVGASLPHLWR